MIGDTAGYDLIARMRERDVAALAELYDRHARAAYSLACRIVGSPAEAEDVVQEAFLQVWQQAGRFDGTRASVLGWLLMITRSRALDRLRVASGRSRWESSVERLEHLSGSSEWSTDRVLIRAEREHEIRRLCHRLPAIQRLVVELAFYEGLTHLEIAAVLCQPLGTVKTRMRLALQKMRESLRGKPATVAAHEPSPFTVALAAHLANQPRVSGHFRSLLGLRVLVVDDDQETAAMVATVLQSAGASVSVARSTSGGLARLNVVWPDVLLTDIAMPRDDGYSLLRQAKAMADSSGRRLIAAAFTALGEGEGERARHAGFAALLAKPVRPGTLLEVIGRVAGGDPGQPAVT